MSDAARNRAGCVTAEELPTWQTAARLRQTSNERGLRGRLGGKRVRSTAAAGSAGLDAVRSPPRSSGGRTPRHPSRPRSRQNKKREHCREGRVTPLTGGEDLRGPRHAARSLSPTATAVQPGVAPPLSRCHPPELGPGPPGTAPLGRRRLLAGRRCGMRRTRLSGDGRLGGRVRLLLVTDGEIGGPRPTSRDRDGGRDPEEDGEDGRRSRYPMTGATRGAAPETWLALARVCSQTRPLADLASPRRPCHLPRSAGSSVGAPPPLKSGSWPRGVFEPAATSRPPSISVPAHHTPDLLLGPRGISPWATPGALRARWRRA